MAWRRGKGASGLALALLAGCAVGPDYTPPPAPAMPRLTNAPLPTETVAAATMGGTAQHLSAGQDVPGEWWTLFHSPEITALVRQALATNPSLLAAQASLAQAKQAARAGEGALLPALSVNGTGEAQQISLAAFGLPPSASAAFGLPPNPQFQFYQATAGVSYTLDVFGGIRREIEALHAEADYQRESLEAAYLSLTTNLVAALLTEASLAAQIAATREIIAVFEQELHVTQQRFQLGGVSRADVLQQQTSLASEVATLPPLQKQLEQTRDQIAVYLGGVPSQYDASTIDLATLTLPADLPVSLPSQIVEQRPDVREYAALLHQATAQVGVALANMLPTFTLNPSVGYEATSISQLFTPSGLVWTIAGSIGQPIFEGGTLLARKRAAVANMQLAAAQYSNTLHIAFQNVADALVAIRRDAETLHAELDAERSADEDLKVTQEQFSLGAVPYLNVLQAQQSYRNAEIRLVIAQAARFTDTVALFAALGGGWWHRADIAPEVAKCCGVLP